MTEKAVPAIEIHMDTDGKTLRRGWTTGTCAAAATKAACAALLTGEFPYPVEVELPSGARPAFSLATEEKGENFARAGVIKDAGDDPDVTHGALIESTVRPGQPGSGITFKAGMGVGTLPGLALQAHRVPSVHATMLPGETRGIFAVTYGEPPDPPATSAVLTILRSLTTLAEIEPGPSS